MEAAVLERGRPPLGDVDQRDDRNVGRTEAMRGDDAAVAHNRGEGCAGRLRAVSEPTLDGVVGILDGRNEREQLSERIAPVIGDPCHRRYSTTGATSLRTIWLGSAREHARRRRRAWVRSASP